MLNGSSYTSLIKSDKRMFLSLIFTIVFASTALGVQRTILALYTDQLASGLDQFILLSGAIALSGYGLAKSIGNFLGGDLSQRIGRRLMARIGLFLLVIGSYAVLLADTLELFLLVNLVIGIGIGIFIASATVMFSDIVTSKRRARSMSIMELSVYGGTSFGSILAGITSAFGYLYSFAAAFVLVLLALIISILLKDSSKVAINMEHKTVEKRAKKIKRLEEHWRELTATSILDSEDIDDLYTKIDVEGKYLLKEEVFKRRQFFHPSFLITFSTGLMSRVSDTAIILLLPLYLIAHDFSPLELGIITSSFTIMWAVGMYITGKVSDEIGRKQPVVLGLIIELTGLSILLLPALNEQLPITLLAIVIAGLGRGTYYPLPASIISDQVSLTQRPMVLGVYRFILDFGYVIGSILLVLLIEPTLFGKSTNPKNVFDSTLVVLVFLLLIQAILTGIFLRDPKPRFRQLNRLDKHLLQVQRSMSLLNYAVIEYASDNKIKSRMLLDQAKLIEQKADRTLEQIIENTYAGAMYAVDGIELLEFAHKMDKALGHSLRAVRHLHQVRSQLTIQFLIRLSKFSILLDFMVLEAVEVIKLLPFNLSVAAQQSYQVNRLEEYLDSLHQLMWEDCLDITTHGLQSVLLVNSIESLEKAANTVEDAVQLIRLIAIKHHV